MHVPKASLRWFIFLSFGCLWPQVASFQELLGLQVGLTQVSLFRERCVHGVSCRWGLELLSVLIEKGSVAAGRGGRVPGLISYQHTCLLIPPPQKVIATAFISLQSKESCGSELKHYG